jgi:dihydroorotate dehydrogenase electron transfer subunit
LIISIDFQPKKWTIFSNNLYLCRSKFEKMQYYKTKVIKNKRIAPDVYVVEVPRVEGNIEPGQFFMIKSWDDQHPLLRPISIYNVEKETIAFMYRVVGKGTELLSKLKKGGEISLMGPLGNGFPYKEVHGKIGLVGGGVGIPPLFETAKRLKDLGNNVDVFLGYKDVLFGYEEFETVSDNIYISCENGKEGYKGYITDLLHPEKYDAVFTCGPELMMYKVKAMCDEKSVPVWLSMERHMACGVGACLVCNCDTQKGTVRACKEGPVFNGKDLV